FVSYLHYYCLLPLILIIDFYASPTRRSSDLLKREGMLKKGFKFDLFITHDIWVWRAPCFIFIKKIRKYFIPILFFKINGVIWNIQLITDFDNIIKVFRCGTDAVFISVIPVFHKDTDNIISLLF